MYKRQLWEEWWLDATGRNGQKRPKSRSDAQTESAFPPALFAEYLLGVQVTQPGWKEVALNRMPSTLSHIQGVVPTPLGPLFVEWNFKKDTSGELIVVIPEGMQIAFNSSSLNLPKGKTIKWNEKALEIDSENPVVHLPKGRHRILF